jgi:cyclin D5
MAGESLSPNDLLRQEDFRAELSVADEDDTYIDISRTYVGDPDTEEEEYLALLANQEPHRGFSANDTLVIDSWFRNARLEAITWILRVSVSFFIPLFFPLSNCYQHFLVLIRSFDGIFF